MSGSLPRLPGIGPESKYILSCGCTVSYITAPPKVGELILCHSCNRGVRIVHKVSSLKMRKVG